MYVFLYSYCFYHQTFCEVKSELYRPKSLCISYLIIQIPVNCIVKIDICNIINNHDGFSSFLVMDIITLIKHWNLLLHEVLFEVRTILKGIYDRTRHPIHEAMESIWWIALSHALLIAVSLEMTLCCCLNPEKHKFI